MLRSLLAALRLRGDLVLENLALRQQLAVYKHELPKPSLRPIDRAFWAVLSRVWHVWREALCVVTPATVVRWHRAGFCSFWTWRSRRRGGRPPVAIEVRDPARASRGPHAFCLFSLRSLPPEEPQIQQPSARLSG